MLPQNIEITSPVGSFESLTAAIQGGAGSVYFGVGKLNMRARSSVNFTLEDLKEITGICKKHHIKTYLALNTVIYDSETEEVKQIMDAAKKQNVDAIIATDICVMEYARRIQLPVHISTQVNITNTEAVRFFSRFADVMVLARELNLEQVKQIAENIRQENICGPSGEQVKIEIFVHGALCMAISGKCYLSLDNFNQSANRGACYQPCRRGYTVIDKDKEIELDIDHEYIMSPKDLCTIGFLDKIIDSGASILKIEGRGRSPEYVKTVTRCYREAVEAIREGAYSQEKISAWLQQLKTVYNRGFWDGYYLGRKLGEWSEQYGSQATKQKVYIGKITNYYSKIGVAEIHIDTQFLETGDEIIITGPTTGVYQDVVSEIRLEREAVPRAVKGEYCSIPVKTLVRRNDKVYKLIPSMP